jgi:hypothetical protein
MNGKVVGIVLLVVGVGLLIWGFSISDSFSGKLSSALTGSPGDKAMILYITGGICSALGIFKLFR